MINNNYSSIIKLPLDKSSLNNNAWLSGFIESDGCFYIRITQNKNAKTKKIAVLLELAQKHVIINGYDNKIIMHNIS